MWTSGDAYEPYVGRWSRLVAERFVGWLCPPGPLRSSDAGTPAPASADGALPAGRRWLDVGCGTGALTRAVLAGAAPAAVVGLDRSPGFLAVARRVHPALAVADGAALPVRPGSVDAVVSGLLLNFLPDPVAAVAGMARAARPGGVVAAYVWDYADGMQPIRRFWDAAVALDPAAAALDEGRWSLCRPAGLTEAFTAAGLARVEVTGLTVPTRFRDFDDYWQPFLGAVGAAPAYLAGLPPDARDRIRERLRTSVPAAPDGSLPLSARAWAVRGTASR